MMLVDGAAGVQTPVSAQLQLSNTIRVAYAM